MRSALTYRQLIVEPPEAFLQVVTPALFSVLRMQPIDVLFRVRENSNWLGFCPDKESTQTDEIVIDLRVVTESIQQPNQYMILTTYLHECAHRLTPSHSHDGVFFALNLMMHLRAEVQLKDLWQRIRLYDIQSEPDVPAMVGWAYKIANEFVNTDKTCEEMLNYFSDRSPTAHREAETAKAHRG